MNHEEIIDDFNKRSSEYDKIIHEVIAYYDTMIKNMGFFMPFRREDEIKVLDLGCGTGNTSKMILEFFPNASIDAYDLAINSVNTYNKRFEDYNAHACIGDLRDEAIYKADYYDCVVSSLAIHHLPTDKEKYSVYKNSFKTLKPNGYISIGENVAGSSVRLTKLYESMWLDYMRDNGLNENAVQQYYDEYFEKDSPISMMKQLSMMSDIGFSEIDCMWKYSFYAVFGGMKPLQ
ncbi:class I SAM-dependent methyltransferase [Anaeromicropila populeti]|uniref:tRNA (Cmo5U34)-methyltransferase n=1 Tax=Anaeromicropila populeti TaxID=37658 RepID=A0A1I6LVP6_9FIRM|nr:class I SAM-dependent methyltransferase [Anaeromicropila populeti]SFS07515.1 tRNA (cmo5U34)-methyltransferase [Anaeromicropila populeti]